jgi:hypothetical protein
MNVKSLDICLIYEHCYSTETERNVQEYIDHGKAQMLPFVKIECVSQKESGMNINF